MRESQPSGDRPTTKRLTIPEAARDLGVTSEAVRGRVKRGTLKSERDADGTVYVLLDEVKRGQPTADQAATDHQPNAGPPRDQSELVEALRARVESLEHQLEEANTRDRENRRLLAAALERMPELESRERSEAGARSSTEDSGGVTVGETGTEPESGTQRRPWWRRIFGG